MSHASISLHSFVACSRIGERAVYPLGKMSKTRNFPYKSCILAAEGVFMRATSHLRIGLTFASLALATTAAAQFKNGNQATELNLPTLSQRAVTTQRIGLTDITINYHAPLVGGRKLFGAAPVPYDKVWRAGANQNTTITFSDDVSIEGKPLAAGTYGLHMIPAADQWTVIFSKNSTSWGSFSYDEKEDALRVQVKPHEAEFRESLAYTFDDIKPDSAAATLRWEKLAVPFRVSTDVKAIVLRSIKNQLRNTGGFAWGGYDEAANWCLDNNYELEQALKWEDQSIQNEDRFENNLNRSEILAALGKKQEAETSKKKAFEVASGVQLHVYGRQLQIQNKQDEGFAVFQINIQKRPNEWYTHGELARIASAKGDFDTAVKEMKLAQASAPEATKGQIQGLIARLEKKENINPR
jgi:tetratricopeptide (TPR) repeat protein